MPEPIATRVRGDGLELQLYEWPGEGRPIFLAHATGFHARCWDQVVARLPGRHVYALDMRGHGRSDKPAPPYPWSRFGEDVAEVVRGLGLRDALGVGHSKGGYAVTMAAGLVPGAFGSLLLVDPVIMSKEMYSAAIPGADGPHFAARRRDAWASAEEMIASFAPRPPFNGWDPAVLRDYCTYGLLPGPESAGMVLACPPAVEAAVYAGSRGGEGIYDAIESLEIPVSVMRAKDRGEYSAADMSTSPTTPGLAGSFRRGRDIYLPQMSHFIPMEDPGLVAAMITELAG